MEKMRRRDAIGKSLQPFPHEKGHSHNHTSFVPGTLLLVTVHGMTWIPIFNF